MGRGLKLSGVSYSYPLSGRESAALSGVSMNVTPGEVVCVAGPNGAGKSTLALVCAGLLDPDEGTVSYGGEEIRTRRKRLELRRKVGLLFQAPEDQLFADTVAGDIAFGPRNHGLKGEDLQQRVRWAASLVGLDLERLGGRSPFSLSAGERRRVAIAGVLATGVEVLVLDEPFIGLDHEGSRMLERSLRLFLHDSGNSIVVITHDLSGVWGIADRFVFLEEGEVRLESDREEVAAGKVDVVDQGVRLPQWAALTRELDRMGFPPSSSEPGDIARALACARETRDVR